MKALRVLLLVTVASLPAAAQSGPRMGLRLDSRSSMQWSGDTLMLQREADIYYELPVDTIHDVWIGTERGSFTVLSEKGIGMLVGQTLAPSAVPYGRTALLRSSRPDVLFACVASADSAPRRKFMERRTKGRERELFVAPAEVKDFDVDISGRVVVLTTTGRVLVATGAALKDVPLTGAGAPSGQRLSRIFVDDRGSEISVLGDAALFRMNTSTGAWTSIPFSRDADALVRHAASRRVRIEPKFVIPRS